MIGVDANVLIEIALKRKDVDACQKYIESATEKLAVTMLTVDLVMYYAESNKLNLHKIRNFLKQFLWIDLTEEDGDKAFDLYEDDDYEDALQITCTMKAGCKTFATLDKGLAKKYKDKIKVDLLSS